MSKQTEDSASIRMLATTRGNTQVVLASHLAARLAQVARFFNERWQIPVAYVELSGGRTPPRMR